MDLFIATAWAQEAGAQPNAIMQFAPILIIGVLFYFLMLKPQKKRLQEEQSMLSTLGKGDEVYTKSGMIGKIAGMTEKVITLEISEGVKIKILRSQIGGLAKKIFEKEEKKS